MVLALSVLFFGLVLASAYFLVIHGGDWADGKISTSSGLLQGVLGSAIGLAAALATLYLAVTALRSVKRQDKRDELELTNSVLRDVITPIQEVGLGINAVYWAQGWIYHAIREFHKSRRLSNEDLADQNSKWIGDLQVHVSPYCDEVVSALKQLEAALQKVSVSPLASAAWRAGSSERRYEALSTAFPEVSDTLDPNGSPAAFLPMLGSYRRRMERMTADRSVVQSCLTAYLVYLNFFQNRIDDDVVPAFPIFIMFSAAMGHQDQAGAKFGFPSAALFADLVDAIPTTPQILDFIQARFSLVIDDYSTVNAFVSACPILEGLPSEVAAIGELKPDRFWVDKSQAPE